MLHTAAACQAVDLLWLGVIARRFYLNHLGRFFAERVNWAAAFAFYLLFLAGILSGLVSATGFLAATRLF